LIVEVTSVLNNETDKQNDSSNISPSEIITEATDIIDNRPSLNISVGNVFPYISKVTPFGEMDIEFTSKIHPPASLDSFNGSVLEIILIDNYHDDQQQL